MQTGLTLEQIELTQKRSYELFSQINEKYFNQIQQFGFNKFWRLCISKDNCFSMISDASVEMYQNYLKNNLLDISEIVRHPDTIISGIYLDTTIYKDNLSALDTMRQVLNVQNLVYCVIKLQPEYYSVYVYNAPNKVIVSGGFASKMTRLSNCIEKESFLSMRREDKPIVPLELISGKSFTNEARVSENHDMFDVIKIGCFLQRIGLIDKNLDVLSDSELKVLYMLGQGLSVDDIMEQLKTTKRNAYYYISSLKDKLGIISISHLNEVATIIINFINPSRI